MHKHNDLRVDILYFEITDKCNYSCKYCYNRSCISNGEFLHYNAFQRAVECFSYLGLKGITYSGGEPMLHPELKNFLAFGAKRNLQQLIITNASMLNEEWCKYIEKKNILMQLTMDGSSATLNEYTRGKSAYKTTMAALELLKRHDLTDRVMMRCNISFFNMDDIERFVHFISSYQVRQIEFSLIMSNGRGQEFKCLDRISDIGIIQKLDEKIAHIGERENVRVSLVNSDISLACPFFGEGNGLRVKIDSAGSVYPCQALFGKEFALCNIYDVGFDHKLFADQFRECVRTFENVCLVEEKCARCHYRGLCSKSCIADMIQYKALGMDEQLCAFRKMAYRKGMMKELRKRRGSN